MQYSMLLGHLLPKVVSACWEMVAKQCQNHSPEFAMPTFTCHTSAQPFQHHQVEWLVDGLTLRDEFWVYDPFDVKETDQHRLQIRFKLMSFFWMRRAGWVSLAHLLFTFGIVPIAPWLFACDYFVEKLWIFCDCDLHCTTGLNATISLLSFAQT